jgi:hypothetical protein
MSVSPNFISLRGACPDLPLSNGRVESLDEKISDLFRVAEWLSATSTQTY